MDVVEKAVAVEQGDIRYWEAGTGHPVLLLHGSGPGATGWSNYSGNISALAERFRVIAVDCPGWGESFPARFGVVSHRETHIQFMDALGIERAALVGNSLGGITATLMAARHPERVSHLITMGSATYPSPRLFSAAGMSEGIKALHRAYLEPTLESMKALCSVMTYEVGDVEALAKQRLESTTRRMDHVENYLEGFAQGGPVTEWFTGAELTAIEAPTLVMHGRDDRVVPYEHSLDLVAHIPDSRLHLQNRCGHWMMIEHRDEFNRVVAEFITAN